MHCFCGDRELGLNDTYLGLCRGWKYLLHSGKKEKALSMSNERRIYRLSQQKRAFSWAMIRVINKWIEKKQKKKKKGGGKKENHSIIETRHHTRTNIPNDTDTYIQTHTENVFLVDLTLIPSPLPIPHLLIFFPAIVYHVDI